MFLVQKRFGNNLKNMLRGMKSGRMSLKSTVQIGLQLIDLIQVVHKSGICHLDIKPDNILIASDDLTSLESSQICLIDFGISRKWRNEDGFHVKKDIIDRFVGNILFASKNAFKGYTLSRRDDLIMLTYLLCFLITGRLEWLGNKRQSDPKFFNDVTRIKIAQQAEHVCKGRAFCFLAFCEVIFKLKFKQEPPYNMLKHLLRKSLLETDRIPDLRFEWSRFKVRTPNQLEAQLLGGQQRVQNPNEGECQNGEEEEQVTQVHFDSLPEKLKDLLKNLAKASAKKGTARNSITEMGLGVVTHNMRTKKTKLNGHMGKSFLRNFPEEIKA